MARYTRHCTCGSGVRRYLEDRGEKVSVKGDFTLTWTCGCETAKSGVGVRACALHIGPLQGRDWRDGRVRESSL